MSQSNPNDFVLSQESMSQQGRLNISKTGGFDANLLEDVVVPFFVPASIATSPSPLTFRFLPLFSVSNVSRRYRSDDRRW
jgi:hypothetical protein